MSLVIMSTVRYCWRLASTDKTGNIRKAMKEWAERDKQSKYVVIPDAGHCANQDNYEFFNKLMMEFLEGLGL